MVLERARRPRRVVLVLDARPAWSGRPAAQHPAPAGMQGLRMRSPIFLACKLSHHPDWPPRRTSAPTKPARGDVPSSAASLLRFLARIGLLAGEPEGNSGPNRRAAYDE